ncbi:hypothetical protein MIR68_010099 [Amoeboaphelidium protococcarum]|nr:hypothetical protein MIR68_010099 [Amoeboaphelidium protococcarum]
MQEKIIKNFDQGTDATVSGDATGPLSCPRTAQNRANSALLQVPEVHRSDQQHGANQKWRPRLSIQIPQQRVGSFQQLQRQQFSAEQHSQSLTGDAMVERQDLITGTQLLSINPASQIDQEWQPQASKYQALKPLHGVWGSKQLAQSPIARNISGESLNAQSGHYIMVKTRHQMSVIEQILSDNGCNAVVKTTIGISYSAQRSYQSAASNNTFIFGFFDCRQSAKARFALQSKNIACEYIRPAVYGLNDALCSRMVLSKFVCRMEEQTLQQNLCGFGEIQSIERLNQEQTAFLVQYFDSRDCAFAIQTLNGKVFYQSEIVAQLWRDGQDLASVLFHAPQQQKQDFSQVIKSGPSAIQRQDTLPLESNPPLNVVNSQYIEDRGHFPKITVPQQPIRQEQQQQQQLQQNSRLSSKPQSGIQSRASSALSDVSDSNQINLVKILNGEDSRTTFMIKNIPNKYTQSMLIDFLNESLRGKFDFLYLRMDFKNQCNVGYCFINFIDARDVVQLALRICGKKWPCFNSDKVATLTYANIQGQDALIQKFRNSAVMNEKESFRPKLFKNGQEIDFPPPNSMSQRIRQSSSESFKSLNSE